jgi:hypothetical protein
MFIILKKFNVFRAQRYGYFFYRKEKNGKKFFCMKKITTFAPLFLSLSKCDGELEAITNFE